MNYAQPPVSEADLRKYEEGWTREMVNFWRERIMRLAIWDTGALYRSLTGTIHGQTIEHRFLAYGIYVAAGTGKGYKRGNPGDLPFLKDWKHTQHRHRQKRDWYNAKLYSSVRRLGEFEASFYGELYKGLTVEHFTALFSS